MAFNEYTISKKVGACTYLFCFLMGASTWAQESFSPKSLQIYHHILHLKFDKNDAAFNRPDISP
ncbi:MAG: hypothetical protein R3345_10885, partial [Fulvivirga sp.]|nr:hypothetical protein [Fulvivirga sp.]